MTIWIVLKILGIILLVLYLVVLINALLFLFVPFRYAVRGKVHDPEGSSRLFHLNAKEDACFTGEMKWLAGIVHVTLTFDKKISLELRLFGFKKDMTFLLERKKKPPAEKEEKQEEPAKERSFEEKLEAVLTRVERAHARACDILYALDTEWGRKAKETIAAQTRLLFEKSLPAQWEITGTLGLGDPARSAKVLALQGITYPVTAGHVAVGAEYELYRFDLQGMAGGSIRMIFCIYAGLRMMLDKNVRRLFSRIRRGPR